MVFATYQRMRAKGASWAGPSQIVDKLPRNKLCAYLTGAYKCMGMKGLTEYTIKPLLKINLYWKIFYNTPNKTMTNVTLCRIHVLNYVRLRIERSHTNLLTKCRLIINSHLVLSWISFRWDKQNSSSMNINELHLPLCLYITKTQHYPVSLAEYVM